MRLLFILVFLFNLPAYAQENKPKLSLDNGTIDEQFEYVIKKSSNWQEFEVIKKTWMNTLKSHVNDSLNKEKNALLKSNEIIKKQQNDYNLLREELKTTNDQLTEMINSKNTIKLFGISLERDIYKSVIWSLIAILLFALLYFIYIYKNSNTITQKALSDYNELNDEYTNSRTRSLEREQVLNRRLQDEINKQKKS